MAHAADHRLIPDCKVSVAGKKLEGDNDAALTSVDVDLDVDLFGQCVLTFNDPKMRMINGSDFKSGTAIKVEIGFHTKLKKVFEGEVVALEPLFRRDSPPSLKVICQESIHRLALSQMTRSFNDVDDKEIASKIAQEHGLTGQAPSGTKEHILQGNVTDAAFLRRLAAKHGNTLRIEGKKLIIGPPPKGADIDLKPGDGLRKVKVKIKANTQVGEVHVHGWDPKTKKEIIGKAKPSGEIQDGAKDHGKGHILAVAGHEHMPADMATAEAMAKGRLAKIAEGFIEAKGDMIGNPEVKPGAVLNLDKMGEKIDGQYRVEHAAHAFSKHGYWVNFKAVRIGKKKPPKPVKHDWATDDFKGKDPEELEVGPDGKYIVKDGAGEQVKWHKPRLEHLILAYDNGEETDTAVDVEWGHKQHKGALENLEFEYRWPLPCERDPNDVEFQKAKNDRIEHLKFGYHEGEALTAEQVEDQKRATHKPRLEDLEEWYERGPRNSDD